MHQKVLKINIRPSYDNENTVHKYVTGVKLELALELTSNIGGLGLVQILGQEGWSFSRQVGRGRQNILSPNTIDFWR